MDLDEARDHDKRIRFAHHVLPLQRESLASESPTRCNDGRKRRSSHSAAPKTDSTYENRKRINDGAIRYRDDLPIAGGDTHYRKPQSRPDAGSKLNFSARASLEQE